jgi:N-acetylglucosamine-6-phosphate deacetylase
MKTGTMEKQDHSLEGIHYSSGKHIRLAISGGKIGALSEAGKVEREDCSVPPLPLIAPGLVDIQINGFSGVDFNQEELRAEQIEEASERLLKGGVTTFFPTLITGSPEKTGRLLETFAKAMEQNRLASRMIGGIHLEGPFISREDGPRGAHPEEFCLDPDPEWLKVWQVKAGGNIKLLTLAPELPGSESLIRTAVDLGMVVGIGHTSAGSEQIRRAVEAGATLSTHLGNGCHKLLPRHPNYLWDQLAEDRLFASMIADGFHLPDAVLRVFTRQKEKKAILVSDGMTYTGLEPGLYDSPALGKVSLTPGGKLHLEGDPMTLAGSARTLLTGVVKMAELLPFDRAWDMGSVHPSTLMNLATLQGMAPGAPANLVLLDPHDGQPEILQVYKDGISFS